MSRLATVEKITEIKEIPGADFISAAKIQGYWSVIKKNEYKVNDLIIFIQPDSLIPRRSWNQFLWPKNDQDSNGKPIRLVIKKLKKQISQGLIIPVGVLSDTFSTLKGSSFYNTEGQDVTNVLGITHYEKPIPAQLAGKIRGNFPNFLRKTDELRLLSYPDVIKELENKEVYISTKYDGSSMTVYHYYYNFGVCSRNLDLLEEDGNSFWKVARQLDLENKLKQFGFNAAIQLELIGEGFQGNKLGIKGLSAQCFNIFDIDNQKYIDYNELTELCNKFDIPMVEVIYKGLFNFTIEQLQEIANNTKYNNGNPAEGTIIRPIIETYSFILDGRLSVKVISETFALKYGE